MMETKNKLDASGLLYEGSDFEKWQSALQPILVQHFPGVSWSSPYWTCLLPPNVSGSDVSNCIRWQVSPYIRARVPEKDRKTPRELLLVLRATARPFRFMELPAEIRLRVYKLELPAKTSPQTLNLLKRVFGVSVTRTFQYKHDPLVEPQLLSINRQIRVEALPMHYRKLGVNLVFSARVYSKHTLNKLESCILRARSSQSRRYRPTNTERVNAIHRWALTVMPDSMRFLRRISVQLPLLAICSWGGSEDMLHLNIRVSNGKPELHVTPHTWLKPASQDLLRDHASAISNVAHTLKLEGEALILFLTSRPDIWDRLELAAK